METATTRDIRFSIMGALGWRKKYMQAVTVDCEYAIASDDYCAVLDFTHEGRRVRVAEFLRASIRSAPLSASDATKIIVEKVDEILCPAEFLAGVA